MCIRDREQGEASVDPPGGREHATGIAEDSVELGHVAPRGRRAVGRNETEDRLRCGRRSSVALAVLRSCEATRTLPDGSLPCSDERYIEDGVPARGATHDWRVD